MNTNEKWLKFVLTGKADDYLNFARSREKDSIYGSDNSDIYANRSCYKGKKDGRAGQASDSSYR